MFDHKKTGFIETNQVAAILNTMGQQFDSLELQITIKEIDKDSKTFLIATNCGNDSGLNQGTNFVIEIHRNR